jgi:hypothetical protein
MADLEQLRQLAPHDAEARAELDREELRRGLAEKYTVTINGDDYSAVIRSSMTVEEVIASMRIPPEFLVPRK